MIAARAPIVSLEKRLPWEAVWIDDTRQGFYALSNENWDGETCGRWEFIEQANMAVVLLDEDGIGYDEGWSMMALREALEDAVGIDKCERCLKGFMHAQLGASRECGGCRS